MATNYKIIFSLLIVFFCCRTVCFGQMAISSNPNYTAHDDAILDVDANQRGILTPRMTSAQRSAISAPATGLLLYDTDTNSFWLYNGTAWDELLTTQNSGSSKISDSDYDTKIETEANPDENIIRLTLAGTEKMNIRSTRIELLDTARNTFIGQQAGMNNTGTDNTFYGSNAGKANVTGNNNTFLGSEAGALQKQSGNTYIGENTGRLMTWGNRNTFLGAFAGEQKTGGNNNTFIGREAGQFNGTGSGNVFIGPNAGQNETGSNLLYIDNTSTSSPLIYGDFSTNQITVNGKLTTERILLNDWLTSDGDDEGIFIRNGGALGFGTATPNTNFFAEVAGDMKTSGYIFTRYGYVVNAEHKNIMVTVMALADGGIFPGGTTQNYVASVEHTGTGSYTINFPAGTFSNEPIPMVMPEQPSNGDGYYARIGIANTAHIELNIYKHNGDLTDANFNAIIIGEH